MSQYLRGYKCLPNALIYEKFVFINSSQTEHRICDRDMVFNKSEINCNNLCVKDCEEVYYLTRFENPMILNSTETIITIRNQKSIEFEYISQIKWSFIDYMSNIGGLFGLWVGLSFIDVFKTIKPLIRKTELFVLIYIEIKILARLSTKFKNLIKVKLLISKFKRFLNILERLNWRKCIKYICLPIIIYQVYNLTTLF